MKWSTVDGWTPKSKLKAGRLYLGDNGRCFCGTLRCAGMTAYFTGRDLSGMKVLALAPGSPAFHCEGCNKFNSAAGKALEVVK
jgi:hypothetical protein